MVPARRNIDGTDRMRPWAPVAAVALILAGAIAVGLSRLGALDYDWDEGTYWQSLESMRQGHRLFAEVFSSQPPMFLAGLEPVYRLFGGGIAVARAEVLVLALVGLAAVFVIGRAVAGPWAGAVGVLVLAFDPSYLRLSTTVQADLPAAAVGLAALACATEARSRDSLWLWLLAGITLAVAVETKLLALAYGPPMLYLAVATRRRGRAVAVAAAGAIAITALSLLPFLDSLREVYRGAIGLHLLTRGAEPQSFSEKLGVLTRYRPPWPTLLAAALGLVMIASARRSWLALILLWLVSALAVDLGQAPMFAHHMVIVLPALAVAAGAAPVLSWRVLPRAGWSRRRTALAIELCAVAWVATAGAWPSPSGPPYPDPHTVAVRDALERLAPPGSVVVTDLQFAAAAAGHVTPPQMVDVSFARVWTGDLSPAQAERATEASHAAAVVFVTRRLASIPGYRDWVAAHYHLALDLGEGVQVWTRDK